MTIQRLLICGVFFLALFGGLMISLGIPGYIAIGTEAFIYLLLLIALITRIGRGASFPHLWYSFFYMLLIGACSAAVNGTDPTRAIFSLRLLYRFYFFYLGITLLRLDDHNLKNINLFVACSLLLQLPVVAIKFSIYGISERTQGAYAVHDGSMSTMLPIVVIFYLATYYCMYRPKLGFIFLGICFVTFSIVGKKRAIFFLYPIQFLCIYYFIYIKAKRPRLTAKIGTLFLLLFSMLILSGSILYYNDTLNPQRQVGGSIDPQYALEYAREYTTGEDEYGYSYGRVATTIRVFKILYDSGFDRFLLGVGPGSATPSLFDSLEGKKRFLSRYNEFKIGYGLTSMTKIALEYGALGVIAFSLIIFIFARMCLTYYKLEDDPYWKAFAGGSVGFAFSMLFFFCAYHSTAFWGDTLPALYFFAMAVVYTKLQRIQVRSYGTERLA